MRKLFITLFLSAAFLVNGQKKTQPKLEPIDNEKMHKQIDSSMKAMDSLNAQINGSFKKGIDSAYNHLQQEQNNRNLDAFMAMQRERQAKEKKRMWTRLGLGIFFFAVLVYGVMRKKKKTAQI